MTISFIGGKMIQTYLMVGDDLKYLSKKICTNINRFNSQHCALHPVLSFYLDNLCAADKQLVL